MKIHFAHATDQYGMGDWQNKTAGTPRIEESVLVMCPVSVSKK